MSAFMVSTHESKHPNYKKALTVFDGPIQVLTRGPSPSAVPAVLTVTFIVASIFLTFIIIGIKKTKLILALLGIIPISISWLFLVFVACVFSHFS
jgi:hypothetical protein